MTNQDTRVCKDETKLDWRRFTGAWGQWAPQHSILVQEEEKR